MEVPGGIERLLAEQQFAIAEAKKKLEDLEEIETNYEQLKESLGTLPKRISHPITVPLNSVGFFRGELIHTNELTVLLSSEYLVQVSADSALKIVDHRIGECKNRQAKAKEEIRHFSDWKKFTSQEKNNAEGSVDIREDFRDEQEARWRVEHAERVRSERLKEKQAQDQKVDEAALWERLDELELEEELENYKRGGEKDEVIIGKPSILTPGPSKSVAPSRWTDMPSTSQETYSQPKSILKRSPSSGSIGKSVHFEDHTELSDEDLDSDDDEGSDSAFSGMIVERDTSGQVLDPRGPTQTRNSRFKSRKH